MLAQLLTETVLGAMTGYVTNDTAIRSMFRPGGVIEKTRDDFAREAGLLLEDQVLTRAVLEQQMALPEVQQTLADALRDFLQQRLRQAMEQQSFGDLPDSGQMAAFLQELLMQFAGQEKERILLFLKKHLPVETLLSDEQCEKLCSQLQQLLLDTLQQENLMETFWQGWYRAHKEQSLDELGLGQLCDILLQNAAAISSQWPKQIKQQYGEQLQPLLLESVKRLELRPVLLELDGMMAQYTLQQYLQLDEEELRLLLTKMMASSQGQALTASIAAQLVKSMETIDVPAAEVIPEGLLDELAPLLQQQVPMVMERILDWLRLNSQSVNEMLESAVEEIAEEIGGMKGMLLEQLKETVLAQFLEQSSLVDLLQQTVMTDQTSHEAASLLMAQLQTILTEQKVGDFIDKLNQNHGLETVLQKLIDENLQRLLEKKGSSWIGMLLNWKPGSLKLAERQDEIEQLLSEWIIGGIDGIDLEAVILQQSSRLKEAQISTLLTLNTAQLENAAEQAVRYGCRYLAQQLPKCSADAIYRPLYDGLEQLLARNGGQFLEKLMAQYTVQDLLSLAKDWMQTQQPQLVQLLSQTGLNMMQGQLSRLAEDQIQRLDSDEMLTLVRDLMGQELKPLNYLGAGMGAVAGATVGTALSTAVPVTAAVGPAMMASVLAGKSAVFGAVGYVTNCAAVKGLFWPYEPVGGVEMIQGVIPKQKKRFAHSMGALVDRYVINETVLHELLQKAEPNLRLYVDELAGNEMLMKRLAAELAANRSVFVKPLIQWSQQNGETACHTMTDRLGGMPFAFLKSDLLDGRQLEQHLLPMAERWLSHAVHSQVPLKQLIKGETFWQLAQQVLIRQDLPDLKDLSRNLLDSDKSMKQLLGDDTEQNLRGQIGQYLEHWLTQKTNQQKAVDLVGSALSAERLKQWLEQNSGSWVEQNLSSIFGMVEQVILQFVQTRQDTITTAVQSAILNRMGLMQQMGYAMMGGDAIVAQVVDRILQQKLPIFLSVKSRELQQVFMECWDENIFPAILQMPLKQEQMEEVLHTLLEQPVLHQSVSRIAVQAVDQVMELPMGTWGRYIQLDGLLERVQIQLGFQWQRNGADAVQNWAELVQTMYNDVIGTVTVDQLTRGYGGKLGLQQLMAYDGLSDVLRGFQLRLQENIAITRPQHWLHWDKTAAVLDGAVHDLLQDERVIQWMEYEGQLLFLQMTEQWDRLLPLQSRRQLLQPVMQAAFSTAEAYGTRLLQAMDLANLTEAQLIAMDSAHLERVVRGFAGHYLVHIENRGWTGALFALPGMLIYLI